MKELQLRNRQRDRRIETRLLGTIAAALLEDLLGFRAYELAIHLVSTRKMTQINEDFLKHDGPTDVITFNLREMLALPESTTELAGEIYICVRVAENQASEFSTTWQEELVRYVVHGVLHLTGHDDLVPEKRRAMKREENRLLRALGRRFTFAELGR